MADQEEALARQILADAEKRAERLRARAEREAAQIVRVAEKEAQAEREKILDQARRRVARQEEVGRAVIEHEVAALARRAREGVLDRVRDEAERRLDELGGGGDCRPLLVALALQAIEQMDGEAFLIVLADGDRRRHGEQLPAEIRAAAERELGRQVTIRLADETLDAEDGGLLVRSADGHQEADQTFAARLERLWDQIRTELARRLGGLTGEGS